MACCAGGGGACEGAVCAAVGLCAVWQPRPPNSTADATISIRKCLIFICIYHLPPSRRVGRARKSYYPVFGRVNVKRGLPKLLPEPTKRTIVVLSGFSNCESRNGSTPDISSIRFTLFKPGASKNGKANNLQEKSDGRSSPKQMCTPQMHLPCFRGEGVLQPGLRGGRQRRQPEQQLRLRPSRVYRRDRGLGKVQIPVNFGRG